MTINKQDELNQLLLLDTLETISEEEILDTLCKLIEHSNDIGVRTGTHKAIELAKTIDPSIKFKKDRYLFHYYLSLAFSDLRADKHLTDDAWQWDQEDLANEIINLRYASLFFNESKHPQSKFLQIHTNLANLLDNMGRFIPAIANWNKVLAIQSNFGTALAAKGHCMLYHARFTIFDSGHKDIFLRYGHKTLKTALDMPLEKGAKEYYLAHITPIEKSYPGLLEKEEFKNHNHNYNSPLEKQYRNWALKHFLFLNPLNDIGDFTFTDYDPLLLPTMTIIKGKGASFHSMFNEIKKQYTTARYFLFEGIYNNQNHFSENDVKIYDLLDSSNNSYRMEQVKISYRLAYSIFDKIACFLNHYLDLGISDNTVSFRNLWYEDKHGRILKSKFVNRKNLMLRALYWLSKDIHPRGDFLMQDSIEPEAKELARIRNHIEHKGFKVISENPFLEGMEEFFPEILKDNFSMEIKESEFIDKAIKVLKLSKEAITYLSLSVYQEEDSENDFPSIQLDTKH